MPIKFKFEDSYKGAWILLRQTHNLILRCEDRVFSEYGLTTEQHAVLMVIKHIGPPVRITDVALWLDRSVNSVSMIVDRMVKAGLVRRTRDRKDRRVVFVTITSKAEKAFVPATVAGWGLIQEILSPLSDKDRLTLIRLLGTLRDKTYDYLGSGEVVEEVRKHEAENMAQFMKQAAEYKSSSTPEAKRQGDKKKKAIR
ncbi:MAG: MarR family transcriptional regulator [Dehalococcoidia bacterium]|nr:MAG: MarR family transcriptional regulator [Dehalococcoidia bacterium]